MRTDRCRIASLVLLALAAPALAGPLTPPVGVIQSTMKTLAEVEPRTPISDATTPGDGDSRFRITQPGSYYLTSSFTVGGGLAGIEIAAHDVTIDLNGFTITGGAGTRAGVQGGVSQRPTLRNGTIRAMTLVGVDFSGCDSAVIERVTVESCAGGGIVSGNRALISDCIGFTVGSGAVAVNCTAYDNNGDGFTTNDGAVIQDCLASSNEDDGFDVTWGITVTGSVAIANAGHGFAFGAHCHIEGNSARGNGSSHRPRELRPPERDRVQDRRRQQRADEQRRGHELVGELPDRRGQPRGADRADGRERGDQRQLRRDRAAQRRREPGALRERAERRRRAWRVRDARGVRGSEPRPVTTARRPRSGRGRGRRCARGGGGAVVRARAAGRVTPLRARIGHGSEWYQGAGVSVVRAGGAGGACTC